MLRLSYLILSFLLADSSHLIAESLYSVTDLGTLGDRFLSVNGINNAGTVVGNADGKAFIYSSGQRTYLGPGEAYAVNDAEQVTGALYTPTGDSHAFLYSNGQMTDLGTLGGIFSEGYGINNVGQITGEVWEICLPCLPVHAFVYSNGQITNLGFLPGGEESFGLAINGAGQVTGYAETSTGQTHAFIYSNGQMSDLGTLPGYTTSSGSAINNAGQVTGYATPLQYDFVPRAFLYSNGQMTDLGTLGGPISRGYGINDAGQVVGSSDVDIYGHSHAFLYRNGRMVDLNSLTGSSLGITLTDARAINDYGQIVANGSTGSDGRAFLLTPIATPVPEPSTLAAFGLVLLGLAGSRRRG